MAHASDGSQFSISMGHTENYLLRAIWGVQDLRRAREILNCQFALATPTLTHKLNYGIFPRPSYSLLKSRFEMIAHRERESRTKGGGVGMENQCKSNRRKGV
jgi:hypothetical protein